MLSPLHILVIEDMASDYLLLARSLSHGEIPVETRHVGNVDELNEALEARHWDVVLCDYSIPGLSFEDAFHLIRRRQPEVPVIVVSGSLMDEDAVDLLRLGASDFVLKDRLARLMPAICRSIEESEEKQRRQRIERELEIVWERLDLALTATNDGLWDWDLSSNALYLSPRWFTMLGYGENEYPCSLETWRQFIHPDDLTRAMAILSDATGATGRERIEQVLRMRSKDGTWHDVLCRAMAIRNDGQVRRIIGTNTDVTAISQAQHQSLQTEARYKALVEASAQIVWSCNARGEIFEDSPSWQAYTGSSMADGDLRLASIHPEDKEELARRWRQALSQNSILEMDHRLRHHSGQWRWTHCRAVPLRLANGRIGAWVGMNIDIHDKKLAELNQQRYEQLVLNAGDGLAIYDRDLRVCLCNREFAEFLGHTPESIRGLALQELLPADRFEKALPHLQAALQGQSVRFQLSVDRPGRGTYHISLRYQPLMQNGQIDGIVASLTDVSELKQAEQALRQTQVELEQHRDKLEQLVESRSAELRASEARLRLAIAAAGLGAWEYDPELECHLPALSGNTLFDLHQGSFAEFLQAIHPEDREAMAQAMGQALHTEGRHLFEYRVLQQGTCRWVADTFDVQRRQGRLQVVGTLQDITERRQADATREAAREAAEQLARIKSEFLANMSHEIRTPLNAILGFAQLGQRETPESRARIGFQRIHDAGQHLLGIINDILDFSKIEAGKMKLEMQPTNPCEVVDHVVKLMAASVFQKGLELRVEESDNLPAAFDGDSLRLAQVLLNLLGNALKFTDQGSITLREERDGQDLIYSIRDTGIGMNREQLGRLFHAFEQGHGGASRRFGGTGLGLTITKRLVEMMGGSIEVESTPGQGTCFSIRIPMHNVVEAQPSPPLQVGLLGFEQEDRRQLAATLAAYGISTAIIGGDAATTPSGLALVVADVKVEPALLGRLLQRGERVAVLHQPGCLPPPSPLAPELQYLERPLRACHVESLALGQCAAGTTAADPQRRLGGIAILIAEDNQANRLVLRELLESEGASIVCVENGLEAVETLQRRGPQDFQLFLTDVQMPVMDGYTAAREVSRQYPELPIIGVTANVTLEDRQNCLNAGMVDHVGKPYQLDALVEAILRVVRSDARPSPLWQAPPNPLPTPATPPPPPASDLDSDAIDWPQLRSRLGVKPGLMERFLRLFLESNGRLPDELRDLACNPDLERLRRLGHALYGSAANLAAVPTATLARRLEYAAAAGEPESTVLAGELADQLERLFATIHQYLDQLQENAP